MIDEPLAQRHEIRAHVVGGPSKCIKQLQKTRQLWVICLTWISNDMITSCLGFIKARANLNFNWMRFRAHGTTDHEMDASIADRANFRSQIGFTEGLQDLLRVPFPMIRDRSFDLFPRFFA